MLIHSFTNIPLSFIQASVLGLSERQDESEHKYLILINNANSCLKVPNATRQARKMCYRGLALQHKKLSSVRLGFEVKGDVALERGQSPSG